MLKVLNFIKNNKRWRKLFENDPYHINIVEDEDYMLLKYKLIDGPDFSNEIVRECRGIIIRKSDMVPVCIPFFKFGNYGESYVPKIDWSTARILEKIDGSIIKVWFDSSWHVSTNGSIDAYKVDLAPNLKLHNFGELFDEACRVNNFDINTLDKNNTYMFELVSPYNTVVIEYDNIDIYHLGTRNNTTLEEIEVEIGVKKPTTYNPGNDLSAVIKAANAFGTDKEGFVVVDKNYNRIKVKSEEYVYAHYLNNNNLSDRKLLEFILSGEIEEVLTYLPRYTERVNELNNLIDSLEIEMNIEYRAFKKYLSRYISNNNYHGSFLTKTLDNPLKPKEFLRTMPIKKAYGYLNRDRLSKNI